MKVAKEFDWEMGHRLPFHKGKCVNLHGHSYRAIIAFEGEPDENGFIIDFYDMKQAVLPIIEKLDHAFMVYENDTALLQALEKINTKLFITPFHSTVENISRWLLQEISKSQLPPNITSISIKLYETNDSYAEAQLKLK